MGTPAARARSAPAAGAVILLLGVLACSAPSGRVVVVGMDGLEYSLLDRMISAGELPSFARVMQEGARADLQVIAPIMSPVLWTTMASGYPAEAHGIKGWTDGQRHPYSGADVRVGRVWDAVSAAERRVLVVGWLMSWPASPVRGQILTDRFVWSFPMNKSPDEPSVKIEEHLEATTFPAALAAEAAALQPDEGWLASHPLSYQVQAYGAPFHPLRRDETHVRVFEQKWPSSQADFGAVYVNGADQVSHLYWPFCDPEISEQLRRDPAARDAAVAAEMTRNPARRPPPYPTLSPTTLAEAARYVPDYYRYLDTVLGRVLAVLDADTTLLLLSDHGFRASSAQPLIAGSHNPTAVFVAWGPRVKPGPKEPVHVYDVGPTLYALLGLPAAADMPGKVRTDIFEVAPQEPLPTRKLERAAPVAPQPGTGLADQQLLQQLEALGYLNDDVEVGASRRQTSP